jgi:hypothetical protein
MKLGSTPMYRATTQYNNTRQESPIEQPRSQNLGQAKKQCCFAGISGGLNKLIDGLLGTGKIAENETKLIQLIEEIKTKYIPNTKAYSTELELPDNSIDLSTHLPRKLMTLDYNDQYPDKARIYIMDNRDDSNHSINFSYDRLNQLKGLNSKELKTAIDVFNHFLSANQNEVKAISWIQ